MSGCKPSWRSFASQIYPSFPPYKRAFRRLSLKCEPVFESKALEQVQLLCRVHQKGKRDRGAQGASVDPTEVSPRRIYPRSAPDKQACRSSSGVCAPVFAQERKSINLTNTHNFNENKRAHRPKAQMPTKDGLFLVIYVLLEFYNLQSAYA